MYSPREVEQVLEFQIAWEAALSALDAGPGKSSSFTEAEAVGEWTVLRSRAATAAEVFAERGRLPEDREV